MGDSTYRVVLELATKGSLAPGMAAAGNESDRLHGKVRNINSALGSMGSAGASVMNSFSGIADKVVGIATNMAALGAAGGIAAVVKGVFGINNSLEKTQIGLAAIFGANDLTKNMNDGMEAAGDVMKKMRADAAALPGEFKDLVDIFKDISVPGFQSGASIDQLRKMASQGMAVSAVMGLPMQQAGRELSMLLSGRAGAHNVLGLRIGGLSGDKAQAFNKMSGADRFEAVSKMLGKFAPAIDEFSKSFEGAWSTFKDNATRTWGQVTSPLFERMKSSFLGLNSAVDANQDRIDQLARMLGGKLANAFDVISARAAKLVPFLDKGLEKLATGDIGSMLGKALGGVVGVKVAGMGAGMIGSLFGAIGPAMSMIAAAGPMGIAVGVAALAAAIGGLGVAAVAIYGAFNAVTDQSSTFYTVASAIWTSIQSEGTAAFESLKRSIAVVQPLALMLADAMGTMLLGSMSALVGIVSTTASAIETLGAAFSGIVGPINVAMSSLSALANLAAPQGAGAKGVTGAAMAVAAADAVASATPKNPASAKAGGGGGGGGTNIQKVEIVVTSNQDPSRVARLTLDAIKDLSRNPRSSPGVRSYSG